MAGQWKRISGVGGAAVTALATAAALVNYQSATLAGILAIIGVLLCFWFGAEICVISWRAGRRLHSEYHNARYSMLIVILIGAVFGGSVFGGVWWLYGQLAPRSKEESALPPPVTYEKLYGQIIELGVKIEEQGKQIANLTIAQPPEKLQALKDENKRLLKQSEELAQQEKESRGKELTIQTLEEGRKRHLAAIELEKQQRELAEQRRSIEREEQIKKAEKEREPQEIAFAEQYAPIIESVITTLYQKLRHIADQSGRPIATDFPTDPPSLYNSNIYKDGKIIGGQHTMRIGSSKDWEVILRVAGPPDPLQPYHRGLGVSIHGGVATVRIFSLNTEPPNLRVDFKDQRDLGMTSRAPVKWQQDCAIANYKQPVDEAFSDFIQNRYIADPLKP